MGGVSKGLKMMNEQTAIFAIAKAHHDGVAQKVAEQVMQGQADPWLLHVAAIYSNDDGEAQIIMQDESRPAIRDALVAIPDVEGVKVLEDIFLKNSQVAGKLKGDIGGGQRYFIYARRAVAEGVDSVCVDICSHVDNATTSTRHPVSSYGGALSVALQPFPVAVEHDAWTLVFPLGDGSPTFINTKKDGS